ncbi:transposase family protein [Streptomyces sp. CG1]|uniref:transposase family protein n=1 Tax=Streptomyces sp. CG1 TaxID=1287523 RepID=UPI0034E1F143
MLGLDGVTVVAAQADENGSPILALVTACQDARHCPECGQRASRSLGLVTTSPRDLPLAGRPTLLRWTIRRWECRNPACDRRSFTESGLPYQRPQKQRISLTWDDVT